MQYLIDLLRNKGYVNRIIYDNGLLRIKGKETVWDPNSLFFIDAGYRVMHTFVFAISAPKYDIKGVLELDLQTYHMLGTTPFAAKFDLEIEQQYETISIHRQYGMRKITKSEFDANRYILRKGFPDFPNCPYGHTFKMLGYDTHTQEYVRLAPDVLKLDTLKTEHYKE